MTARRSPRVQRNGRVCYRDAETETPVRDRNDEDEQDYQPGGELCYSSKKRKRAATLSPSDKRRKASNATSPARKVKGRQPAKVDPFNWHDLPNELKNLVYEFALVSPTPIKTTITEKGPMKPHRVETYDKGSTQIPRPATSLNLLLVDKQRRTEAGPIFWGHNTFHFPTWFAMYMFLRGLGADAKAKGWITTIEVGEALPENKSDALLFFDTLATVTNLKSLRFDASNLHMGEFHKCASKWLKSMGEQRGNEYAAFDVLKSLDEFHKEALRYYMIGGTLRLYY
ncbi:short-chain dehydrogenase reductase sdr protein [Diplodia corticola]|uniref:Short-chain dehydrogenase reductase sdr protein n=1 Tax=Diplodia corticola TaxID=236234 RepID=A0A1J9QMH2_9PEZI|nr:short-chain dehydrogenase reductase sdr protein [Diplodia corticola]OJD29673.1 short-chain dehydrogenase reductase sdr protein [Diplodia corticola]